ncbi:RNA-binding protein Musashi like protein Rbp6 [Melipona quadrifasciata]|uniref:RNA-binding protein Musashi like protein Rbp6 n=1 Tax=Melipona quadrifasciata TaxID=166423 RepID=A0A0M9A1J3_9HYME|nr:RNA-binding protein Musashi like protein Rbp6 [Melipona quadrifasciata]
MSENRAVKDFVSTGCCFHLASQGFGFITFADPASVDKVLAQGNHELDGKKFFALQDVLVRSKKERETGPADLGRFKQAECAATPLGGNTAKMHAPTSLAGSYDTSVWEPLGYMEELTSSDIGVYKLLANKGGSLFRTPMLPALDRNGNRRKISWKSWKSDVEDRGQASQSSPPQNLSQLFDKLTIQMAGRFFRKGSREFVKAYYARHTLPQAAISVRSAGPRCP